MDNNNNNNKFKIGNDNQVQEQQQLAIQQERKVRFLSELRKEIVEGKIDNIRKREKESSAKLHRTKQNSTQLVGRIK